MKLWRRIKPYHRRDWRRFWRYCRCGYRWRCPDSVELVPMPYQPPPPPPLSRANYRAALRAAPADPTRTATPSRRPRPTNRRDPWLAPIHAHHTNSRTADLTSARQHRGQPTTTTAWA
ncbi:hypothetical protein Pen02_71580 [Plantactinospora endophytica]|uniref:Uncharacterized protein n=1 Tax=Plantactinospora endophytica TaxID=673535 RepID=A0ABQ4ED99_9ACTN|nr:hypothetical protein Pen02_71580 [Plantactinospora endophytica]